MTDRNRWLSLDLGDRRTGVALSDPGGILASPIGRIDAKDVPTLGRKLVILLQGLEGDGLTEGSESFCGLVVGLPLNQEGLESPRSLKARDWGEQIAKLLDLPVRFIDERFSTRRVEAADIEAGQKAKKAKAKKDARSAAEILQGFLDSMRENERRGQ